MVGTAQHSTLRFTDQSINLNQQSLLLVPFESKMYTSDINRELATENQLSSAEIVQRFTMGIDQAILYTFEQRCNVSSFYQLPDGSTEKELSYVYDNLLLEYELVSKTEDKSKLEKLKSKLNKKEDDSYHRGSIENGQLITKRDDRERYMKAVVKNQQMLDSMTSIFNNNFFLFVNQIDIHNVYDPNIAMRQNGFDREIKLHYTLYHKNGEILSTGISRTTFPYELNNINIIIKEYFPILAQNIFEDLFPSEEETEKSKLKLNPWK
jgi:hypothetical protein